MSNYFDDVGKFHEKFNLPVADSATESAHCRLPQLLSRKEFNFRTAFLFEEIRELIEGYGEQDLAKMADALVDIVYVALGTAHYAGVPFDELWKEVQRANMEKRPWQEGDPVKPRNTTGLEIVKPEGWISPDIRGILEKAWK